uniref:Secreted protein n=1 Tax=Mycobacterium phage JustASigh TaxID=3158894 RepID=A0AAU8GM61_9CAUD
MRPQYLIRLSASCSLQLPIRAATNNEEIASRVVGESHSSSSAQRRGAMRPGVTRVSGQWEVRPWEVTASPAFSPRTTRHTTPVPCPSSDSRWW